MAYPNLSHLASTALSDASAESAGEGANPPQGEVGAVSHGMSAEAHSEAVERAARLMEYFIAEWECYGALWDLHGDFTHKAAADTAFANALTARRLLRSLLKGATQ